jgi:hypothetical protein
MSDWSLRSFRFSLENNDNYFSPKIKDSWYGVNPSPERSWFNDLQDINILRQIMINNMIIYGLL